MLQHQKSEQERTGELNHLAELKPSTANTMYTHTFVGIASVVILLVTPEV